MCACADQNFAVLWRERASHLKLGNRKCQDSFFFLPLCFVKNKQTARKALFGQGLRYIALGSWRTFSKTGWKMFMVPANLVLDSHMSTKDSFKLYTSTLFWGIKVSIFTIQVYFLRKSFPQTFLLIHCISYEIGCSTKVRPF